MSVATPLDGGPPLREIQSGPDRSEIDEPHRDSSETRLRRAIRSVAVFPPMFTPDALTGICPHTKTTDVTRCPAPEPVPCGRDGSPG